MFENPVLVLEHVLKSSFAHLQSLFIQVLAVHVSVRWRELAGIARSDKSLNALECRAPLLDILLADNVSVMSSVSRWSGTYPP